MDQEPINCHSIRAERLFSAHLIHTKNHFAPGPQYKNVIIIAADMLCGKNKEIIALGLVSLSAGT
jgi:hypothetical protein